MNREEIKTYLPHREPMLLIDSVERETVTDAKGHQVDYVLGNFSDEENKSMPERLKLFGEAILSFASIGADRTMNSYNGK